MAWYYVTRLPWKDEDALPPVKIKSSRIHCNAMQEARTGKLQYGWIEIAEKLGAEDVEKYGLIYGGEERAGT